MRIQPLLYCAAIVSLFGCASLPKDTPQWLADFAAPPEPKNAATISAQNAAKPFTQSQQWWREFNDPLMNTLAENIRTQNLDIKTSLERVKRARALANIADAALLPTIDATAAASRGNRQSPSPTSVAEVGFDAAWEIDLFGANRAARDAAIARITASAASADDVRNTVIADLIRAVVDLRSQQARLATTEKLLRSNDTQIAILTARANAGLSDEAALERARAQRSQTATELPLAKAGVARAAYTIERLLGTTPYSLSAQLLNTTPPARTLPAPKDTLALTAESLAQRPDIRVARANLLAAQSDLKSAEANLWPRVNLGAFFGAGDASNSVRLGDNPLWQVAPSITLPILNFGALQSAVDAANAGANIALNTYKNTSLIALQEAHTALSDTLENANAVRLQSMSVTHRTQAVALAQDRFKSGLSDMSDVTTAQAELDNASLALISLQADAQRAIIALHKALGSATASE